MASVRDKLRAGIEGEKLASRLEKERAEAVRREQLAELRRLT